MARKKKHPEHVNHERWLVSYADFITLLFAFFVVMFAVSQVDSKKVGRFTESFSKAIGIDMFPEKGRGLMAGGDVGLLSDPDAAQVQNLVQELQSLRRSIRGADGKDMRGDVQILQRKNELVLRLSDGFLFESGNDALEERARKVISRLAAELKSRPLYIRVEGHTDNRPIKNARFRSNWDLSTARATAVVARLAAEGISPERLSAAGYGEFHPVATNATEEGRKQNRRVDLIVSMPVNMTETPAEEEDDPKPKAAGTKPGEAKPAEPKTAEAKPAEPKPGEAKPAEPKPAEPKPGEPETHGEAAPKGPAHGGGHDAPAHTGGH